MQKLIIATIGLSLSMGVAPSAIAQSAAPDPMPATNGSTTATMPTGPSTASPATTPADPSTNSGTAMPGAAPSTGMASDSSGAMATPPAPAAPQSYPRCSASVHDECRQRN